MTNTKYIPALDGLRGIAILLVLGYHYFHFHHLFSIGWVGVDLFFVLSGYLITKRLIENKEKDDRYARFYKNRALRILPLYYLILILFFSYTFIESGHFYQSSIAFCLFFQNWIFIFKTLPYKNYLLHTWSLAIEEQFYLIWPLLLYTFYSAKHFKSVLWILIALIPVVRCISFFINPDYTPPYLYYFNTFCRIDTMIWGALIYFIVPKEYNFRILKRAAIISFAILIVSLFLFKNAKSTGPFFSTIGYTLLACIFATILYRIVNWPQSAIAVILNNVYLRKIGKVSYGFYLVHMPILAIITTYSKIFAQKYPAIPSALIITVSGIISALLSYLVSYISFYYYESYFLKRKK